ncbi:MAG: hypothetical protein KJ887_00890 [Candidatus Omnitrophica bacterium]|nr:hypothetical protein [Candidatus Omnitrophota bacterium]MBU1889200.1 hypothetical protein [Candidatus Omnitrophota bacterium]
MPNKTKNLIYQALPALINGAESISWNRFNNFLLFNSILILAWATIYANINEEITTNHSFLLGGICILGLAISFIWCALGFRGRSNVDLFLKIGKAIESNYPEGHKPITEAAKLRDTQPFSWSGSTYILTITPLLIALLYTLFLWFSIPKLIIKTIFLTVSIILIIVFICLTLGYIKRRHSKKC